MKKKLIVLDIDGTLVNSKKVVTPKTREAIIKAIDAGHMVMIASGRPTPGLMAAANAIELPKKGGYLLSFNGAKVEHAITHEIIYQQKLPKENLAGLYKYACDKDLGLITYNDKVISARRVDDYISFEARLNGMDIIEPEDFVSYVDFDVNKCLMTANPETSLENVKELQALYGDVMMIGRSEPFFIEVTAPEVDKALTLSKVLPILGVDREDMICCGDGFNDKTMIEYAGLGVAMANAQEEVKLVADYITSSCDEDGVAEVIYKFVLGE